MQERQLLEYILPAKVLALERVRGLKKLCLTLTPMPIELKNK